MVNRESYQVPLTIGSFGVVSAPVGIVMRFSRFLKHAPENHAFAPLCAARSMPMAVGEILGCPRLHL